MPIYDITFFFLLVYAITIILFGIVVLKLAFLVFMDRRKEKKSD